MAEISMYSFATARASINATAPRSCPGRAQVVANEYRQAYAMFDNDDEQQCDDYIPSRPEWSKYAKA